MISGVLKMHKFECFENQLRWENEKNCKKTQISIKKPVFKGKPPTSFVQLSEIFCPTFPYIFCSNSIPVSEFQKRAISKLETGKFEMAVGKFS